MSYRILIVSQLVQAFGHPITLFRQEDRVVYEAKRAMSVAYADRYYITSLTSGYTLTCF